MLFRSSVILQNLDQLEAVYEKSYETIMGNCDTHVFLGSNSFKTVEYFSKALGEKTISRESKSVSKDKHFHKQGFNYSDQYMARALMTPDELRRMDNDICIIYEKGIKPVKANKYYYFTHDKLNRELQAYTLNHNHFDAGSRGEWRKYNPYNPYVPDNRNVKQENLKVESLDDLFDEEIEETKKQEEQTISPLEELSFEDDNSTTNANVEKDEDLFDFETIDTEANNKLKEQNEDMFTEDLQKELETKFDELFGTME